MNGFADSYRWSPGDVIYSNHLPPLKKYLNSNPFFSRCFVVAAMLKRSKEYEKTESYSMLQMDGGYFELSPEIFKHNEDDLLLVGKLLTEDGELVFDLDANVMLQLVGEGFSPENIAKVRAKAVEINNWEGPKEYRRLMREKDEKQ